MGKEGTSIRWKDERKEKRKNTAIQTFSKHREKKVSLPTLVKKTTTNTCSLVLRKQEQPKKQAKVLCLLVQKLKNIQCSAFKKSKD